MNAMLYSKVLDAVLDREVEHVKAHHSRKNPVTTAKREAAIAAISDCRSRTPDQLRAILDRATVDASVASQGMVDQCVKFNDFAAACMRASLVAWVCECVSAYLIVHGRRPITDPVRGPAALEILHVVKAMLE